ncbi:MAG: FimB/Mfa2 family fimbrial subunit [Phocaeicola sp.]
MELNNTSIVYKTVLLLLSFFLFLTTSCQKFEEEVFVEMANFSVSTRSIGSVEIPYPIWIYAFSEAGNCVDKQQITSDTDKLKLDLPIGKYELVALAGNKLEYVLPDYPNLSDAILITNDTALEPAMMGRINIALTTQSTNIIITLNYIVAAFKASFSNIPSTVDGVSVHLSPLYSALSLSGDYSDGGKSIELVCQNEAEGVWSCDTHYIFPGSGQRMAFSISLQEKNNGMKSYGYQTSILPKASYPYIIHGIHSDGMFQVGGGLVAEGWRDPIYVDFDFGPSAPEEDTDPNIDSSKIPEIGTIWNDCIVLNISDATASSAKLFLLSINEWEIYRSQIDDYLDDYNVAGIPGWRIPTYDEAGWLNQNIRGEVVDKINNSITSMGKKAYLLNANERYLCDKNGIIYSFAFAAGKNRAVTGDGRTYLLRAVTEYTLTLSD